MGITVPPPGFVRSVNHGELQLRHYFRITLSHLSVLHSRFEVFLNGLNDNFALAG